MSSTPEQTFAPDAITAEAGEARSVFVALSDLQEDKVAGLGVDVLDGESEMVKRGTRNIAFDDEETAETWRRGMSDESPNERMRGDDQLGEQDSLTPSESPNPRNFPYSGV